MATRTLAVVCRSAVFVLWYPVACGVFFALYLGIVIAVRLLVGPSLGAPLRLLGLAQDLGRGIPSHDVTCLALALAVHPALSVSSLATSLLFPRLGVWRLAVPLYMVPQLAVYYRGLSVLYLAQIPRGGAPDVAAWWAVAGICAWLALPAALLAAWLGLVLRPPRARGVEVPRRVVPTTAKGATGAGGDSANAGNPSDA